MPSLDTCINNLYEPGNIGSSSGQPPTVTVTVTSSEARFAGAGSLRANATKRKTAEATFAGASTLSARTTSRSQGSAQLAGAGSLSANTSQGASTFQTSTSSATDGTTFTFTSQAIGTAGATRRVIVGTVQGLTGGVTASSVTIDATSATLLKRQVIGNGNAEIWMATVASGTTATIEVIWSSLVGRCGIAVWAVPSLTSDTPIDTDGGTVQDAANGSDVTITTAVGAYVFAIGMTVDPPVPTVWRNLTQQFETTMEIQANTHKFTAADAIAGSTSMTVGLDGNGGDLQNSNSPFAVVVLQ